VYEYGLKSRVKIRNDIKEVKSKIRFPYEFDSSFDEYLDESEFIDINGGIKNKANEILEGEDDYYEVVYKLSGWVKDNIEYDLNTVTAKAVKKSSWVLENKNGVCPCLTANMGTGGHNVPLKSIDLKDKLTPEECERLQTLPIGYTSIESNSQRYKMIGNGWTVDVIVHLFSSLNVNKNAQANI